VKIVDQGGVACARCGRLIEPGGAFDLDHSDDRTHYIGVSHPACNRGAASRRRSGEDDISCKGPWSRAW
jgi:hypothetical protein